MENDGNGFVIKCVDKDLLTRTAMGITPFPVPDENYLKNMLSNFSSQQAAFIPISRAEMPYASGKNLVRIDGILDYEIFSDGVDSEFTDDVFNAWRNAVMYASSLSPAGRQASNLDRLYRMSQVFEAKLEEVEEKISSLPPGADIPAELEEARAEYMRLAKAYAVVLEEREKLRREFSEKVKDMRQETLNLYSEPFRKLTGILSRSTGSDDLLAVRQKAVEVFEKAVDETFNKFAQLMNSREGPDVIYGDGEKFLSFVQESFGDDVYEKLREVFPVYEKLAGVLEASGDRSAANHLKLMLRRTALLNASVLSSLGETVKEYEEYVGNEINEVNSELEELRACADELKKSVFILDVKKLTGFDFSSPEELSAFLDGETEKVRKFFLRNEGRGYADLSALDPTARELYERLTRLAGSFFESWNNIRNLRTNQELLIPAARLFNMDLLLEKVRTGEVPPSVLADRSAIAALLGYNDRQPPPVVEALSVVGLEEAKVKPEPLFKSPPISTENYLQILRDLKTLEFTQKMIDSRRSLLADSILKKAEETQGKRSVLLKGIGMGLYGLYSGFNGTNVRFSNCLQTVAFPSDTGLNTMLSHRLKNCMDRFFSDLEQDRRAWESMFNQIASPRPENIFAFPVIFLAGYMQMLKGIESGYWKGAYMRFERDLNAEAEKLIYSLTPENVDQKMRDFTRKVMGIEITVKPIDVLSPEEATPVIEEPRTVARRIREDMKNKDINTLLEEFRSTHYFTLLPYDREGKLQETLREAQRLASAGDSNGAVKVLAEGIEPVLKRYEKDNTLKITVKGKNNALVFKIDADKVRRFGGKEFIDRLLSASPEDYENAKESLLEYFGISQEQIKTMLDSGKLKNGMEYREIFSKVLNSLAIRIARVKEHEKTLLARRRKEMDLPFSSF